MVIMARGAEAAGGGRILCDTDDEYGEGAGRRKSSRPEEGFGMSSSKRK